ncbi:mCG140070, partial [Mus musculus]
HQLLFPISTSQMDLRRRDSDVLEVPVVLHLLEREVQMAVNCLILKLSVYMRRTTLNVCFRGLGLHECTNMAGFCDAAIEPRTSSIQGSDSINCSSFPALFHGMVHNIDPASGSISPMESANLKVDGTSAFWLQL